MHCTTSQTFNSGCRSPRVERTYCPRSVMKRIFLGIIVIGLGFLVVRKFDDTSQAQEMEQQVLNEWQLIMGKITDDPFHVKSEVAKKYWRMVDSFGWTDTEYKEYVDSFIHSGLLIYFIEYWKDVKTSVNKGAVVRSPNRAKIQKKLVAEDLLDQETIDAGEISLERMAFGLPVEHEGRKVVVTSDIARDRLKSLEDQWNGIEKFMRRKPASFSN